MYAPTSQSSYDARTRISQMQHKTSLSLHCVTNRGIPFLAHIVSLKVALGQGAIDAQGASYDGLYSFWISDKFSLFIPIAVVAIIFIMPANLVV